jgi:hypothetical protein
VIENTIPYPAAVPRWAAFGAACICAPTVTLWLSLVAIQIADSLDAGGFGSNDIWRFARDLILAPLSGIAFGFIGAAVFLGAAFLLAPLWAGRRSLLIAGSLAGLAHALAGLLLRYVSFMSHGPDLARTLGWVGLIGGFLAYGGRPIAVYASCVAEPIAGFISALLYLKARRIPDVRQMPR